MDNTCMIIKKKEYQELIEKLAEFEKSTNNTIIVNLNGSKFPGVLWYNVDFSTEISLSNGITSQIRRIISRIEKIHETREKKLELDINTDKKLEYDYRIGKIKLKFSELSWYKRLFFKPEYLD